MTRQPEHHEQGLNWAILVWILLLTGIPFIVTALAGLIIAAIMRRRLAGTAGESHMIAAIRTVWITALLYLAAGALLILPFYLFEDRSFAVTLYIALGTWIRDHYPLFIAAASTGLIWYVYRCGRGLLRACRSKPMDKSSSRV